MSTAATKPVTVKDFFHKDSNTCCFVCYDPETKDAIIIDPVTDLDTVNWVISHEHNTQVLDFVKSESLKVHYILDTHVHADHLTGGAYLRSKLPGVPYCIGDHIRQVQKTFAGLFNLPDFKCDGSQFDKLLHDNDDLQAGSIKITCWHTPGHTPNCMCFLINGTDAVFTGDLMFTEDFGCGRCDFPGGSAADMFDSVMRLYNNLPGETRVFVGHDYQPGGRPLRVSSTIALEAEKQEDLPKSAAAMKEEFVKGKSGYDATLNLPRLIFPALRINMNAGVLPPAAENGTRYLTIPLNFKSPVTDLGEKVAQ